MKGYWKNESATRETMDGEWLRTGDIAYYDNDGHFYIVDRIKELIKVKGFQVSYTSYQMIQLAYNSPIQVLEPIQILWLGVHIAISEDAVGSGRRAQIHSLVPHTPRSFSYFFCVAISYGISMSARLPISTSKRRKSCRAYILYLIYPLTI